MAASCAVRRLFTKIMSLTKLPIAESQKYSFWKSLFRNYDKFHLIEMSELLEIDGSLLEGGGQILRNAISMSAILGIPVKVTKIRAGRSKPGLAAQHLKGIELVAAMCNAKLNGAAIGSTEIEFRPGKLQSGQYLADTKTAGSITLLLQVALPCALLAAGAGVSLELRGGTNADMAPQIDYLTEVFAYVLKRFRAEFNLNIHRRGYFPKGGGRVTVEIKPVAKLHSIDLTERGNVTSVLGWSFVAGNLPVKIAHEMADGAKEKLRDFEVKIESYKEDRNHAPDNCNGIVLVCESSTGCVLGADGLGKRGVGAHEVGAGAGDRLAAEVRSGACVDSHAQDQIIIYMALAEGRSVVRTGEITLHTKTAIHIAELIAKVQFTVEPDGDTFLISCTGLGIVNK